VKRTVKRVTKIKRTIVRKGRPARITIQGDLGELFGPMRRRR